MQQGKSQSRHISGSLKQMNQVEVLDINLDQLTISTADPLPVGTRFKFDLTSPGGNVQIPGNVFWCTEKQPLVLPDHRVRPVFHAGIRIADLSDRQREALQDFLVDSMMITLKGKLFGCIEPDTQKWNDITAEMASSFSFTVLKMGMSGAKLRTGFSCDLGKCYEMEMRFGDQLIHFEGKVVHIDPEQDEFVVKVLFTKLGRLSRERLERYLSELKKNRRTKPD